MGHSWDEIATEERRRCKTRRARVLAHPEIAIKLTQPPLRYSSPGMWTGYIPPAQIEGPRGTQDNDSQYRKALIAICNEVLEAERSGSSEQQQITTPSSPGSITEKQLTRLHIMLGEAQLTERDDKLDYCQMCTGRQIGSTKELSQNEASIVMDMLGQIISAENGASS